jgi:hypothetical protein
MALSYRSIAFASASSQTLSIAGNASANTEKFTIAGWWKAVSASVTNTIVSFGDDTTSNLFTVAINSANGVTVIADAGGSSVLTLQTANNQIASPTSWNHICIAVDTTQATAANRVTLSLNGVAITSGFVSAIYPSQNQAMPMNKSAGTQYVAVYAPVATYYNGKLAEFYYIDGQQLASSSFVGTAGGLVTPISYTGSYSGVFDSYLNFSNSGSLGADSSGEGNNWTPNGSPTQSTDYPADIFATAGRSMMMG